MPELSALRDSPPLVVLENPTAVKPGEVRSLGKWAAGAGLQAEVQVEFALPPHAGTGVSGGSVKNSSSVSSFGVIVMVDGNSKPGTTGLYFWAKFEGTPTVHGPTPNRVVTVGSTNLSISSQYQQLMPDLDLCCYPLPNSTNFSSAAACQHFCDVDIECEAWTFKHETGRCTKRSAVSDSVQTLWRAPIPSANTTSGVKAPSLTLGGRATQLQLTATDSKLSIHVFVDHVMAEGF